jgi:hypothetical protein
MSNFKIKTEYIDKTVRVYDRILGQRSIVVAKIDISKVKYYQSIGLGYIFEEVPTVIKYEAVEPPIPAESVEVAPKPKKKRKKKPAQDGQA